MALDIDAVIESTRCCVANAQWKAANNRLLGIHADCDQEAVLLYYKFRIIKKYIPVGTDIGGGTLISVTFDLNTIVFVNPPDLFIGDLTIDGMVIASVNGLYADIDALIDAFVAGIIAFGNGFTATNNNDGTITIFFPPATYSATTSIAITMLLTFQVYGHTFLGASPNSGSTVMAIADTSEVLAGLRTGEMFSYDGFDTTTEQWGTSADFAAGFAVDACYSPQTNVFYVTDGTNNRLFNITPAGVLSAPTSTAVASTINFPSCLCYNPFNLDQHTYFSTAAGIGSNLPYGLGVQSPRRTLGRITSAGIVEPVQFYSNNSADCFSMCADSWTGDLWMMPSTVNSINNPQSQFFGQPSVRKVSGLYQALTGGGLNDVNSPGVTEVAVALGEVTSQYVQAITFYPGTAATNAKVFCMQSTSLVIIDTSTLVTNQIYFDATGQDIFQLTEVLNCVYYSILFDKVLVGTNQGRIYIFNYTVASNNFSLVQIIQPTGLRGANVGAIRKFLDNNSSNSISYLAGGTPGVVLLADQYGTLVQDSDNYLFDDPAQDITPIEYQTEAMNCQTLDQINTVAQQIQEYCGCAGECGDTVQDINSSNANGQLTGIIYYGRSGNTTLNESQVLALYTRTQANFAGIFDYAADGIGTTYIYFCYPSAWGTPSRFADLIGGFDVVMNTAFTVTVLGTSYTCYRSFNLLGGAQSMQVIQ